MALDLKPTLAIALRDTDNKTWTSAELDTLLALALDQASAVRARAVRDEIALVDDQDNYDLVNVYSVTRVDLLDSDNSMIRVLPPTVWEVWGDNDSAAQILYLNPAISQTPYKIRIHGYAPYNYTGTGSELPGQQMQAAILALARAEALRRVIADKARFRQWSESNPRGDTSVTELLNAVNEADSEASRLLRSIKSIKKPILGRL